MDLKIVLRACGIPGFPALLFLLLASACSNPRWETRLRGEAGVSPLFHRGVIYLASSQYALMHYIEALDPQSGSHVWASRILVEEKCAWLEAVDDILVMGCGDRVLGMDAADGFVLWDAEGEGAPVAELCVNRSHILLIRDEGDEEWELSALSPHTGRRAWARDLPSGTSLQCLDDGALLLTHNAILKLNDRDASIQWATQLQGTRRFLGEIDSSLYLIGTEQGATAVDIHDGRTRWMWKGALEVDPIIHAGLLYTYSQGRIHAIDAHSGVPRWTRLRPGVQVLGMIGDDTLGAFLAGGILFSFHASDGSPSSWRMIAPPVDSIHLTSVGVLWMSGRRLWILPLDSGIPPASARRPVSIRLPAPSSSHAHPSMRTIDAGHVLIQPDAEHLLMVDLSRM